MDVQPVINFIRAIEKVWRHSNNVEAESRAEKISKVLEKGNNIISREWESNMKCEPPEELSYMNISKKTQKPIRQRRGSLFPGGMSIAATSEVDTSRSLHADKSNAPKNVKSDLELTSFRQRYLK